MRLRCGILIFGAMIGCQSVTKPPYADNPLLMSREPLKHASATGKSSGNPQIAVVPPPTMKAGKPGQLTSQTKAPASAPKTVPETKPTNVTRQPAEKKAAETKPVNVVKQTVEKELPVVESKSDIIATSSTSLPAPSISKAIEVAEIPKPTPLPPRPVVPIATPTAPAPTMISNLPSQKAMDFAPNYSWLIGEIDVHYRGHKELRFCPISEENAIGGKVRLVDHPQLMDIKPGATVCVEGELMRDDPVAVGGEFPRYHIRRIQVIEKPSK